MARYITDSFTTASIAPGASLVVERPILSNTINLSKIAVVPSVGLGTSIVGAYKRSTCLIADVAYLTQGFSGNLIDPIENDGGGITYERNEGFVAPYECLDGTLKLHLKFTNNHSVSQTYAVTLSYEIAPVSTQGVVGVPAVLTARATAQGLVIVSSVSAAENTSSIFNAEFRALFIAAGSPTPPTEDLSLVSEGGTFVPNGTTSRQVTGIFATFGGAQYTFTSAAAGRWYFAWRLQSTVGWSNWTDGNSVPSTVSQFVDTNAPATVDTGPASGWSVTLEQGAIANTYIARATRPLVNAKSLFAWAVQIKDASTGAWRLIDDNAGAAQVHYDGSAVSHTLSGITLTRDTGSGFGTAAIGDIVLIDVRGGAFDSQHVVGAVLKSIDPGGLFVTVDSLFTPTPLVTTNLRVKIVKPYWRWNSEGYLGDQPNQGIWDSTMPGAQSIFGDTATQEFVSPPIEVPNTVTNPEVRVFFENFYSVSDNNLTHSTGLVGGIGVFGPRLFTKFDDRNYWTPIYPNTNWGTLVVNADGTVSITSGASAASTPAVAGVLARFKILPDPATGRISVRLKMTPISVMHAVGSSAAYEQVWGILGNGEDPQNDLWLGWGINNNSSFGQNALVDISFTPTNFAPGSGNSFANHAGNPWPATSFEVTLLYEGSPDGSGGHSIAAGQYGLYASPTNLIDGSSLGLSFIPANGPQWVPGGVMFFLGCIAAGAITGSSATIKEFEIIEGLAVGV